MLRNGSFLDSVPEKDKASFVEGQPQKLEVLKSRIKQRFPVSEIDIKVEMITYFIGIFYTIHVVSTVV